jgi:hypothetical protein
MRFNGSPFEDELAMRGGGVMRGGTTTGGS